MRPIAAMCGLSASLAAATAAAEDFALRKLEGGGYAVERAAAMRDETSVPGLASVSDLVPLLQDAAAHRESVDFQAGEKLEGVYTVTVGRADGTLGRYEGASDLIIFAAPATRAASGDLTTLEGVVVFALKIDNAGVASTVQRFEAGSISLSRTGKSL